MLAEGDAEAESKHTIGESPAPPVEVHSVKQQISASGLNPNAKEWANVKEQSVYDMIQLGQQQQQQLCSVMQIPKVELVTFDGNPLNYWSFICSFETSVAKYSVDTSAELQRLLQYCTGKARSMIQCCVVMEPEEGYIKA